MPKPRQLEMTILVKTEAPLRALRNRKLLDVRIVGDGDPPAIEVLEVVDVISR